MATPVVAFLKQFRLPLLIGENEPAGPQQDLRLYFIQKRFDALSVCRSIRQSGLLTAAAPLVHEIEVELACLFTYSDFTHDTPLRLP